MKFRICRLLNDPEPLPVVGLGSWITFNVGADPVAWLLKALAGHLGARATLKLFEDADHAFHVPARTGRKDAQIRIEMADALAEWIAMTIPRNGR